MKKTCTSCKKPKVPSEFGKNRDNPDGLQYWCKACFAAYHRDHAKGIRRTPSPPPAGKKLCTRCHVLKSVHEFSKGSREADGLQDNCRACNRKVSAAYRAANAEKERERHAAYHSTNKNRIAAKTKRWQKTYPEKARARGRRFYANNKDAEKARHAAYVAANAERLRIYRAQLRLKNIDQRRAYEREYVRLNRAKVNAKTVRRKARLMQALVAWANHDKIAEFYAEAQHLTKETGVVHHVDHIVPLQSRVVCGLHCEHNLQILTESENSKKHNQFSDVWEFFSYSARAPFSSRCIDRRHRDASAALLRSRW